MSISSKLAVLWIGAACAVWCQSSIQTSGFAKNGNSKLHRVSGTVVNSVTGAPIPRALVKTSPRYGAVLTGADGSFVFEGVPEGTITVVVTKPGFFQSGEMLSQFQAPMLELTSDTDHLVLKLLPEGVITGHVVGDHRESIEHAIVDVLEQRIVHGQREIKLAPAGAITNPEGDFRIDGLAPGVYYVRIRGAQIDRRSPEARQHKSYPLANLYPDVDDIASATPIKLSAGEHREISFSLRTVPTFSVAGKITGMEGWTLGAPPQVMGVEQSVVLMAAYPFEARTGAFEFRELPAGSYTLRVWGKDLNGNFADHEWKLIVDSDKSDLALAINSAIDLPVEVQTNFSRRLSGGHCSSTSRTPNGEYRAVESDCSDYPAARVDLVSLDSGKKLSSGFGPLAPGEGLKVHRVVPGRYWVHAIPSFGGYVQSLRCGGLDLFREPLVVPESGQLPAIELILQDDAAKVHLRVQMEKPRHEFQLLVFSDPISDVGPRFEQTASNEDLDIPLPPGEYKIFAFDSAVEYSNLDVVRSVSDRATNIRVGADGTISATVSLIRSTE